MQITVESFFYSNRHRVVRNKNIKNSGLTWNLSFAGTLLSLSSLPKMKDKLEARIAQLFAGFSDPGHAGIAYNKMWKLNTKKIRLTRLKIF